MDDSTDLSFVWGLLSGVIVGGVAAALLAPRSGSETRERVAEQGLVLQNRASDAVARAQEVANQTVANVQETAQTILKSSDSTSTPNASSTL